MGWSRTNNARDWGWRMTSQPTQEFILKRRKTFKPMRGHVKNERPYCSKCFVKIITSSRCFIGIITSSGLLHVPAEKALIQVFNFKGMFHIRQEIDFKGMFYIRQELDFKGMFLIRQEKDVGVNASMTDSILQCAAVIVQKKENFKTHARACKERGTLQQEPGITSIIASQLCSKLQFQQDHMMCQLMTLFNSMKLADPSALLQLQVPARRREERVRLQGDAPHVQDNQVPAEGERAQLQGDVLHPAGEGRQLLGKASHVRVPAGEGRGRLQVPAGGRRGCADLAYSNVYHRSYALINSSLWLCLVACRVRL